MTTSTYIAEVFASVGNKIFFVSAETRAKAVRKANGLALISFEIVKATKARAIPDATVNDMLLVGKYDMIDSRESSPVIATTENRKRLGALLGM